MPMGEVRNAYAYKMLVRKSKDKRLDLRKKYDLEDLEIISGHF